MRLFAYTCWLLVLIAAVPGPQRCWYSPDGTFLYADAPSSTGIKHPTVTTGHFEADVIDGTIRQWWEKRPLNDQEWTTLNPVQRQIYGRGFKMRCSPPRGFEPPIVNLEKILRDFRRR